MFSRIWTNASTKSCSEQIERLRTALRDCDAVVVGAGAGLSTSAGFVYTGERFEKNFSDFAAKYGFQDMYSGGFYPFATPEVHWAYWSRYIYINRYMDFRFGKSGSDYIGLVRETGLDSHGSPPLGQRRSQATLWSDSLRLLQVLFLL